MQRDDVDVVQLKVRMRERSRAHVERSARENGVSLSAEIAARVDRSFGLESEVSELREQLAEFGTDPHEVSAVKAFALALRMMQRQRGASWREGDGIPYVTCSALRRVMARNTRNPMVEALQPAVARRDLDAEAEALADLVAEFMIGRLPPLPELPQPPVNDRGDWTGEVRQIMTFKVKGTGEVLETVTMRQGTWNGFGDLPVLPEYLEAIEKYRPRHHEVETETGIVQVLKSERSVWDASPAKLTGPEEAARLIKGHPSAIPNRPEELFNRADFDEALNGKPRDDDKGPIQGAPNGDDSSDNAAIRAPARRRKVKA